MVAVLTVTVKTFFTVALLLLLIPLCGCQTFSLTPEQFAAQQKGKTADGANSVAPGQGVFDWLALMALDFTKP